MPGNLDSELIDIVSRHWATTGRPMLFSALGGRLSASERSELAASLTSLSNYVRVRLREKLRYLSMPSHGGGTAPVDATSSMSDADLEALVPPPSGPVDRLLDKPKNPAFTSALWIQFRYPSEHRRIYVELTSAGEVAIHGLEGSVEPEQNWYAIEKEDLPRSDEAGNPPSAFATAEAIRAWAQRHKVSVEKLYRSASSGASRAVAAAAKAPSPGADAYVGRTHGQALAMALGYIEERELARIMIPADIVLNILARLQGR